MIDDRQEHRLPSDPAALEAVAKLDGRAGASELLAELAPHVEAVGRLFDGLVSEREERLSNDPDILRAELAAMGFVEIEEAFRRIGDWRSGRARSLRSPAARAAFEEMLPTLMRAVAAGPEPIRALNRFGDIVDKLSSGVNLYRLLGARPQLADLLALILAHAPPLAEQLGRRPTLLDGLIDESSFAPSDCAPGGASNRYMRSRSLAWVSARPPSLPRPRTTSPPPGTLPWVRSNSRRTPSAKATIAASARSL